MCDFSALSYLILKHGSSIASRIEHAAQLLSYKTTILLLVITAFIFINGLSEDLPVIDLFYILNVLVVHWVEVVGVSVLFQRIIFNCEYRIFGLYKLNLTQDFLSFRGCLPSILFGVLDVSALCLVLYVLV